jgi:RNA polymerase sigma-70 factor (ECF subfamily)
MLSSNIPIPLLDSAHTPPIERRLTQSPAKCDAETLALAQAGDHDAFSELYSRYKRRVFSICVRMVHDFSLAEDLTQETFLQMHRKLASFRGDSAFTTWLHRMTVNTVLMHLRKRVLPVDSIDHHMEDLSEGQVGRSFGTRDLTQAGVVDRLAIERAVADLAPGYRSIFLLHDVKGFVHGEIASMLQCTCGNTKSQLYKARRVLRGALSTQMGPGAFKPDDRAQSSVRPRTQTGRSARQPRAQALSA